MFADTTAGGVDEAASLDCVLDTCNESVVFDGGCDICRMFLRIFNL